ncbi:MAG: NAD(P)H-dependent oxidoreductase subunit E [Candidatus Magasanikbacteria bacterium]|jgi:NADH:ubiquinone oxidoreductase subunit E
MVDKKIRVCCGMTCGVMGSGKLMRKIESDTGLKAGEKNDKVDLNFCSCTGNCHLAPIVAVNGNFIHEAKEETILKEIEEAATREPQDPGIIDASVEEVLNNDFLGDI